MPFRVRSGWSEPADLFSFLTLTFGWAFRVSKGDTLAVDSNDPTTGRPIFLDTGAPDIGVDPTAVGIYAADVGNRIVRSNLTALNAYTYKRAGLAGYALDTKKDYIHDGTGWKETIADTGWKTMSLFSGWSTTSPDIAGYRVINGVIYFRGRLKATSGAGTTVLDAVLPTSARPAANTQRRVMVTSGATDSFVVVVTPAGQITCFKGSSVVSDLPLEAMSGIPVG